MQTAPERAARRLRLPALAILSLGLACGENMPSAPPSADAAFAPGPPGTTVSLSNAVYEICLDGTGMLVVTGRVDVTNTGPLPTQNLTVTAGVQTKPPGTPFQDIAGTRQTIYSSEIAPGASVTVPFTFHFSEPSGPMRLAIRATITNHPSKSGQQTGTGLNESLPAPPFAFCTNTPPAIAINAPANNSVFAEGASVTFAGSASDLEDGDLSAWIVWSYGSTNFGTGATVSHVLPVGTHTVTARVTDLAGAPATAQVVVTMNAAPAVTITSPADGSTFSPGQSISFTATATDANDGDLSAQVQWSSSLSGPFGTGASVSTASLPVGTHTITASVTDPWGESDTDQIVITIVAQQCPAGAPPAYFYNVVQPEDVVVYPGSPKPGGTDVGHYDYKVITKAFGSISAWAGVIAAEEFADGPAVTIDIAWLDYLALMPEDPSLVGQLVSLRVRVTGEIELLTTSSTPFDDSGLGTFGIKRGWDITRRLNVHGPGTYQVNETFFMDVTLGAWAEFVGEFAIAVGSSSEPFAITRVDTSFQVQLLNAHTDWDATSPIVPLSHICAASGTLYPRGS